jgi:archaellum component FlaC
MDKTKLEEEFKEVQIEIAETEKTLQELRNRLDEIVQQIRNS